MMELAAIFQKTAREAALYFDIPLGSPVDEHREDLMEVFAQPVLQMPLRLVD
jgi:hypothetical protein